MKKRKYNLHPKQIETQLWMIKQQLDYIGTQIILSLINCLICEKDSLKQKNYIILVSSLFERLSCLVYLNKDAEYVKPPVSIYYKKIFESSAETVDEVKCQIDKYGIEGNKAEHIHKLIWQIADIVCPMMACVSEQAFISEYAYAIEYVINHDGLLEKPIMHLLFPSNYDDFKYTKGIANECEKYEMNF